MARYSEEQWKSIKLKLTIAGIIFFVATPLICAGPALPQFLKYARKNKTEQWAPKWYYNIGRIMEVSFREKDALEVYIEFYNNYRGDEVSREDEFLEVTDQLRNSNEDMVFYYPWEALKYPDEKSRPAKVGETRHRLLGKVLTRMAKYHEDERDYVKSRHIYECLLRMWPSGSEEHQTASKAKKRDAQRTM